MVRTDTIISFRLIRHAFISSESIVLVTILKCVKTGLVLCDAFRDGKNIASMELNSGAKLVQVLASTMLCCGRFFKLLQFVFRLSVKALVEVKTTRDES